MDELTDRSHVNQRIPAVQAKNRTGMNGDDPSLTNADRCESVELNRYLRRQPHVYPVQHPERELREIQSEMSTDNNDGTLKAQIAALEEQRRELLSINKKWSEQYQLMILFYKDKVQEMKALQQCDRYQERCEPGQNHGILQKNLKSEIAVENKECKQNQNGDVTFELLKTEQEAKLLRARNNTLARREQHQHKEIRRLNKVLEDALQMSVSPQEGSETPQEIWKYQAEVYKEDFMKERQDRERLNEKHLELERRFRKVHSELRSIKSQITCTPALPQHHWRVVTSEAGHATSSPPPPRARTHTHTHQFIHS
ncbi:TNFAIP3-interacting protein 3-like isoform X2 [Lampris incognitus]|uniref:TNFAIP3-interacting protein 3-like isoform X2 n=1 Tax=Lampris incognitus TaxID=2546036 RepID=UPI0024B4F9ED|nr:TNFAIP3-interacting protein 3-like isoform X2 [Lampris incognitus]